MLLPSMCNTARLCLHRTLHLVLAQSRMFDRPKWVAEVWKEAPANRNTIWVLQIEKYLQHPATFQSHLSSSVCHASRTLCEIQPGVSCKLSKVLHAARMGQIKESVNMRHQHGQVAPAPLQAWSRTILHMWKGQWIEVYGRIALRGLHRVILPFFLDDCFGSSCIVGSEGNGQTWHHRG